MYSFALNCFCTFSDTQWAKGILAEIKGFLLVLPAEPSPAGSKVFPVSCWITVAVDASTRSCMLWGALICDCVRDVVVARAAATGGSGTNCIAGVGVEDTEGGVRLVSVCTTAVATALLISSIWLAVKVVAEPEEDVSAIWSRHAFLPACRVNGWLVDLFRGGILRIKVPIMSKNVFHACNSTFHLMNFCEKIFQFGLNANFL